MITKNPPVVRSASNCVTAVKWVCPAKSKALTKAITAIASVQKITVSELRSRVSNNSQKIAANPTITPNRIEF